MPRAIMVAAALLALAASPAYAETNARRYCVFDYLAFCSQHPAKASPALARCFKSNQSRLGDDCVVALVADGFVSPAYVKRRRPNLADRLPKARQKQKAVSGKPRGSKRLRIRDSPRR